MTEEIETRPVIRDFEAHWIQQIKQLDSEAWDLLLRNHADDLQHDIAISLRKRGLPEALVDDIQQETWVTAIRKIGEFVWEDENKFYHWLRAISLNHIHAYQRSLSRHLSLEDLQDKKYDDELKQFQVAWTTGGDHPDVEEEVILREQLTALDRAMRTLKPQEREILLRWLLGETPRSLALVYKMKARSISMILLRAKDKVKANITYIQSMRIKDEGNE